MAVNALNLVIGPAVPNFGITGGNVGIRTSYPLFTNSPIYKTASEYINYATL